MNHPPPFYGEIMESHGCGTMSSGTRWSVMAKDNSFQCIESNVRIYDVEPLTEDGGGVV